MEFLKLENTYLVCKNGLVLFFFYYLIHTSQIALKRIIFNILDYSIFHKVQTTCFNRFNPVYITIRIVPFLI